VNGTTALENRDHGLWWRVAWPGMRAGLIAILALVFVAAYPALFHLLGPDLAAIFVMGVMPASLAYGLLGGIIAGAVALPVNMVLLSRLGPDALQALSSDWAGAATGLCIGVAAGAGRDLFERLRTQALEREIAHLTRAERELARANRDLERARGAAERAVRAKSVLLGRVSHELRTPVAAIVGYVEMLREEMEAGGRMTSPERDLGRIHDAARHLAALLDDLLDVARLESGHFTPKLERVAVGALLRDVSTIATPLAERRANALAVSLADPALEVFTDRRRAEQILLNLVANAAKFTERGRIAITASAGLRERTEVVKISVSDTGIGMTAEQAEHAFEEFYQAAPSASPVGTGLGLSITRHLCQHLGATITLDTSPGKGTTVTVALPVAAPAAGAAQAQPRVADGI
jgi:signal transduction histidine kinase